MEKVRQSLSYGYARVSGKDQNESRQVSALRLQSIPDKRIYIDKLSGKDFNRTSYKKMVSVLKKGDVVYVLSIDRLGRNYTEILEQWRLLTVTKQVDIVVLDMPLLDTRKDKNLLGTFIANLVLEILSFVAESERNSIRERQRQGISEAKKRGVHFGRPSISVSMDFLDIVCKHKDGIITLEEALRTCHMSRSTYYRTIAKLKKCTY